MPQKKTDDGTVYYVCPCCLLNFTTKPDYKKHLTAMVLVLQAELKNYCQGPV